MSITCGWCGSDDTDAEFVDVGVGLEQVTAAVCKCGAGQMNPYHDNATAMAEERKRGWWAPQPETAP